MDPSTELKTQFEIVIRFRLFETQVEMDCEENCSWSVSHEAID